MKHMAYGKAALLGVFVLAGCYSYASEAINNGNYNTVQASPNFVVIKVGDSDRVIARLINDNNNGAVTSYVVSGVGAGIRVDSSCTVPNLDQAHQTAANCNGYYRPIFNSASDTLVPTGDKTAQQFFVLGLATGQYTFTLTPTSVNTGVSRTVTVVVNALNLGPALSKTSGVAGDTITITAPAGSVFSQTSVPSFTNGAFAIASRSADSTKITIIAGPGISGPVTVTNVGTAANPAVPPVTLVSTNTLTTPPVTVAPTVVSNLTPLIGVPITMQLTAGLRFTSTTHVFIGGKEAGIASVSADSSTGTIIPMMGSAGNVTYTNIVLSFLNGVSLSVPSDKSVTVGATYGGPSDPNAGSTATASTVVLRPTGTTVISDTGPFTFASAQCSHAGDFCRFYKFVLTATTTMDADLEYPGGADMGYYRFNSTGTSAAGIADNLGEAPGNQPETGTDSGLAAGTYFIGIVYFGAPSYGPGVLPAPAFFQLRLISH
jgi:hypothetical protein